LQSEGAALTVRLSLTVPKCQSLMGAAMTQLNLSARAYHRILKLTRTIADLVVVRKSNLLISQRRCNTGRS
jgi:predicted ATPase with chaperone activity